VQSWWAYLYNWAYYVFFDIYYHLLWLAAQLRPSRRPPAEPAPPLGDHP